MNQYATLLLSLALTVPVGAQDTNHQLIAARDTVWRAYFHNDTALLRRYIPPAAATLEGGRDSRWNTRADIMSGSRNFANGKTRLLDVKFTDDQVTISGHTAIMRSNFTVLTQTGATVDSMYGRATELFVRQGTTWVNPYWQLETGSIGTERAIPLPDSLGANFALADSASIPGSATDYDALLGTWEFTLQARRPDGSYWAPFTGHWTFDKVAGGGVIEDRWRPDDPSLPMAQTLHTYRTFDPRRRVWQMYGSSATGGEVQPGLTWSDANGRYAIQRNGRALSRIRYLEITANRFLWRSDVSLDNGKTWTLDAAMMEARRIGR